MLDLMTDRFAVGLELKNAVVSKNSSRKPW